MSSTRNRLIRLLSQQKEEFISGQKLSELLNVSRSAIWKHMNELKKDGYVIEGVANKGYRIVKLPNIVSENTIAWGLNTNWIGKKIVHQEKIPSTQILAHQLAQEGAEHGTIIVADEQTDSRGRVNKRWYSAKNKGLWLSIILRPSILPYLAPQLTLLTATVLADVLQSHCCITPQIKWPNDILINEKKVAGILTEMQAEQDHVLYVIVGIGLNVNQTNFKTDLKDRATSLYLQTNKKWDLVPILQQLLRSFELKYDNYLLDGFQSVKAEWETYGFKLNEPLKIKTGSEEFEAIFRGIGEDGALLAERHEGNIQKIYSAEIAWF
ncbi:MAG TPA: biotin--[acetyl-CoA-carboxylase] ligase [Pseudogracilibacillus sp.]|nr:biotin--[acetyl-CoA-carboxylase] ligase [Pseudogracilibacillus sp.]